MHIRALELSLVNSHLSLLDMFSITLGSFLSQEKKEDKCWHSSRAEIGGVQMFVEEGRWYNCNRLQVSLQWPLHGPVKIYDRTVNVYGSHLHTIFLENCMTNTPSMPFDFRIKLDYRFMIPVHDQALVQVYIDQGRPFYNHFILPAWKLARHKVLQSWEAGFGRVNLLPEPA